MLSDLHGRRFGRDNSRLLEAVRKARPDIIALVGDLVDEWSGTEYLRPLLRGLTAMAPTYFVSGNHEWAAGAMSELTPLLKECGVTYLSNTFVTLERNGGADLTLSGHGHGGLWRLPFTDGLLGNGGALLPSYTNGFYTCRDADVFVTRGLGGMVRILNRPEVAVVILRRN